MAQLLTRPPVEEVEEDVDEPVEDYLDPIDRALNDNQALEYVDGEFVEKNVSDRSSCTSSEFITELNIAARRPDRTRIGRVYSSEQIYRCWPDEPKKSRRPDVSVVRYDRWTAHCTEVKKVDPGELGIVPDLAVEIISPGDLAGYLSDKLRDYRRASFPLVWVVWLGAREVEVRAGDTVRWLGEDDELVLPDLLPDFRHRLGDLLAPLPPTAGR